MVACETSSCLVHHDEHFEGVPIERNLHLDPVLPARSRYDPASVGLSVFCYTIPRVSGRKLRCGTSYDSHLKMGVASAPIVDSMR